MVLPQFVNTGFQVLFHSPPGVLFTFPSQYYALSVTKEYLALRGDPRIFSQGSTCLDLLWIPPCQSTFHLRGFHPLWPAFPGRSVKSFGSIPRSEPTSVEKGGDEVWIGEKFQSNPEIAGSPRNSFRASLIQVLRR